MIFSIIVPIYNTPAHYFEKCIYSLMNQTLSEIEIILIDDGSQLDCANMCDEFARKDSRIKVLHQTNQGVSAARNVGIKVSEGEWITFVDADDWLDSDSLEKLYKYLNNLNCRNTVDLLLFDLIREGKRSSRRVSFEFENGCCYSMEDIVFKEYIYERAMGVPIIIDGNISTIWYSCGKIYRKSFLSENKILFPVGISKSEDKIFILNCFEKMNVFSYCSQPLYHYIENESSTCHRYLENAATDRKKVVKILSEIAVRMDGEIAILKKNEKNDRIYKAYMRFVFGIISDVLFLQFYHVDNPEPRKMRLKEAKEFLNSEPFRSSIYQCTYHELPKSVWLKKFLLQNKMVSIFVLIKKIYRRFRDWNWKENM